MEEGLLDGRQLSLGEVAASRIDRSTERFDGTGFARGAILLPRKSHNISTSRETSGAPCCQVLLLMLSIC
jgi:hypothetical protein